MKSHHFAHVLREAARLCGVSDFVVVGSQAIFGEHRALAGRITRSVEVDLYPLLAPERVARLAPIGELSAFHAAYGYYADGVDPHTATLPAGWQGRLIAFPAAPARGLCLETHDLLISKLIASRDKDIAYFEAAACHGIVDAEIMHKRLRATRIPSRAKRRLVMATIDAIVQAKS